MLSRSLSGKFVFIWDKNYLGCMSSSKYETIDILVPRYCYLTFAHTELLEPKCQTSAEVLFLN